MYLEASACDADSHAAHMDPKTIWEHMECRNEHASTKIVRVACISQAVRRELTHPSVVIASQPFVLQLVCQPFCLKVVAGIADPSQAFGGVGSCPQAPYSEKGAPSAGRDSVLRGFVSVVPCRRDGGSQ